ncbi:MAG: peptide chain release factor N(5)-glutamine methyltransferase [Bacteroidales bacterium]|nr:peptide chain release factor N(5)-glutamine methyltransferase [Bacteroidales bacterium]
MTFAEAEQYFIDTLGRTYPIREAKSLFFVWINTLLGKNKTDLVLQKDEVFNIPENDLFSIISRLKQKEPIQYILGKTTFANLPFFVKSGVLIPRPETEELINHILEEYAETKDLRILDIGTGSGCIAIALSKNLDATVFGLDKSLQALVVAKENAMLNHVEINFFRHDIFDSKFPQTEKFNIIVSNPPYVLDSEKMQMDANVVDYEPQEALFVSDKDPLLFYRQIIKLSENLLLHGGKLFFEINEKQGDAIRNLLAENNFNDIVLWQDIHGKDRFIKACYGK